MEENFFVENPEKFENNFFNKDLKREFQQSFDKKSREMVKVISQKHRHAKKLEKSKRKNQEQNLHHNNNKNKKFANSNNDNKK